MPDEHAEALARRPEIAAEEMSAATSRVREKAWVLDGLTADPPVSKRTRRKAAARKGHDGDEGDRLTRK